MVSRYVNSITCFILLSSNKIFYIVVMSFGVLWYC